MKGFSGFRSLRSPNPQLFNMTRDHHGEHAGLCRDVLACGLGSTFRTDNLGVCFVWGTKYQIRRNLVLMQTLGPNHVVICSNLT